MAWTTNVKIPDQKSKAPPALTAVLTTTGPVLDMVHLGDSSNDIWDSRYDGNPWSQNSRLLNQRSKASPAAAGGLMVHLGDSSNRIWRLRWLNGWGENTILIDIDPVSGRGGSDRSPAVAFVPTGAIPNEENVMAYKEAGNDSLRDYFLSAASGHRTGGLSRTAPALAFFDGTLHMAHIGESSNNIWHAIWNREREVWVETRIQGQTSKAPPALAAFNTRLHMVHLGDSSNNIWHSVYDGNQWSTNLQVPDQQSKASPALASFNRRLHMVHLGDSSNTLWHSQWQDD